MESIRTFLRITRITHRKSCLIIISPNSPENLTNSEIRSSWIRLEHCSESLLVYRKSYLVIICPNSHEKLTKSEIRFKLESVRTLLGNTPLAPRKSYLLICPISYEKLNWVKLESVRTLFKITRLAYRKSYLAMIGPNSHEKLTKYESYFLLQFGFIYPYLTPKYYILFYYLYLAYRNCPDLTICAIFTLMIHLLLRLHQNVRAIGQLFMEILHFK